MLVCLYFNIIYKQVLRFNLSETFYKNSQICYTEAVVVSLVFFLLPTASFCYFQSYTDEKVGTIAKSKVAVLAQMITRSFV